MIGSVLAFIATGLNTLATFKGREAGPDGKQRYTYVGWVLVAASIVCLVVALLFIVPGFVRVFD